MKKKLFSLLLFFLTVQFAQAQKFNSKLLKSYSQEELDSFSQEDLKAIEYGITNAVYFAAIPEGKETNFPEIMNLGSSLDFTEYKLKISSENQYYRIKNTDKMLVVKSMFVLKNELINSIK
jgi:hypothetical protein